MKSGILQFSYFISLIISSTPKMSIPVLVFHIRILFKYHQTTFSFEISHNLRNTILGWYRHKHMYMVFARFRFYDLDLLVLTQFSQHYPYIRFDLSVDYLAAVFWCKCYSNLNHTLAAYTTPPATGVLPLCTRLRRVRRNNPPWRSL